jgi:glyoxylase-like metal-dependent hydrolase (beta-lactamase superfamily II)
MFRLSKPPGWAIAAISSAGTVAVAIDPQRDIDRVLNVAGDLQITHVLETHIHNDYVTGGLVLAEATDAQ